MTRQTLILVALLLTLGDGPASGSGTFDAIVGPTPPGPMNCIAVEIPTPPGGIAGLRWVHNDAAQTFPRLVLVEGEAGEAPDLSLPGLVLFELDGPSLTWGHVDFGGPVSSSTGTAYAVIFFPADVPTTNAGSGGGPGIGVRQVEGARAFYLSSDGQSWARFDPSYELAVEVAPVLSRAQPRMLSEMEPIDLALSPFQDEVPPAKTVFHKPFPNPFNPRVELSFALAKAGAVRLEVYDVRGRRVRTLVEERYPVGNHAVVWEGEDDAGSAVASGVYFARFTGPDRTITHRLALIR